MSTTGRSFTASRRSSGVLLTGRVFPLSTDAGALFDRPNRSRIGATALCLGSHRAGDDCMTVRPLDDGLVRVLETMSTSVVLHTALGAHGCRPVGGTLVTGLSGAIPRTAVLACTKVPNTKSNQDYGNEDQQGNTHNGDVRSVFRIEVWLGRNPNFWVSVLFMTLSCKH